MEEAKKKEKSKIRIRKKKDYKFPLGIDSINMIRPVLT